MAKHIPARVALVVAVFCIGTSCQRKGLQELVREELFSLPLGKMEDQIDLFQIDGAPQEHKNTIFMRDGQFFIANGNSGKIMTFTSYGDLISLIYNPDTNPAPMLVAPRSGEETVSTRSSVKYPFKDIGEITVSSDKILYVEDDVPDGKGVRDEKTGAYLNRVILRFDRLGKPQGYIGQEGVGGTPFPFIVGLSMTGRDQLVVVCRLPDYSWQVFWYSKDGTLLYQVEIDPANLPTEKGVIPSLTGVFADMKDPMLYLMIQYYRETIDEATHAQSSMENYASRVYKLSLKTGAYESYVQLPPNPKRKEKSGFTTTEIPAPPNDLLGVSSNGSYYLLGFMDSNLYVLTILDPSGRVRARRYMVIEDSELLFRDIRLSPTGLVFGLLCDTTKARISWWRSDLILKGE
jgi:hypothetical protein